MTENDSLPGPSKRVKYGDKDYEKTLLKWVDEEFSDEEDEEDGDYILSDHSSESEMEGEEDEDNEAMESDLENSRDGDENAMTYYYGKNRFKWSAIPAVSKNSRTQQHNIVLKCPGLKNNTTKSSDALTVWNMLFSDDILDIILRWTNSTIVN